MEEINIFINIFQVKTREIIWILELDIDYFDNFQNHQKHNLNLKSNIIRTLYIIWLFKKKGDLWVSHPTWLHPIT
jgi:hypothetical protein